METQAVMEHKQPRLPVEYESAIKQLAACETIDETLYWRDKSEALAAWAKIYGDKTLSVQARRLKLYAYRRMGILARQLRPNWKPGSIPGVAGGGAAPGVPALLREKGLKLDQANAASAIAKMSDAKFRAIVESPNPPAPSQLLGRFEDKSTSHSWRILSGVEG